MTHQRQGARAALFLLRQVIEIHRSCSPHPPLPLLQESHDNPITRHSSIERHKRISHTFYWKGMKVDIKKYIKKCDVCQRNKMENSKAPGPLQPPLVPVQPWITYPWTLQMHCQSPNIHLSKYAHYVPLTHPYTAASVVAVFIKNTFKLHEIPLYNESLRPHFLVALWREL